MCQSVKWIRTIENARPSQPRLTIPRRRIDPRRSATLSAASWVPKNRHVHGTSCPGIVVPGLLAEMRATSSLSQPRWSDGLRSTSRNQLDERCHLTPCICGAPWSGLDRRRSVPVPSTVACTDRSSGPDGLFNNVHRVSDAVGQQDLPSACLVQRRSADRLTAERPSTRPRWRQPAPSVLPPPLECQLLTRRPPQLQQRCRRWRPPSWVRAWRLDSFRAIGIVPIQRTFSYPPAPGGPVFTGAIAARC